jgi:hypothetical protein
MASVQSAACRRWYFGHCGNRDNGGASRRVGSNTRWCQKWWSVGEWEKRIINNLPRTACVQCSRLPEGRVGSARQQHELSSERRDDHLGWRRCVARSHHLCPATLLLSPHEFERISHKLRVEDTASPSPDRACSHQSLTRCPCFCGPPRELTSRAHAAQTYHCARACSCESFCPCFSLCGQSRIMHAVVLKVAHPHMHHATPRHDFRGELGCRDTQN